MLARQLGWADAKTGTRTKRSGPLAWLIRSLKIAGVSVGLMAASIGGYWGAIQYQGNFHAVSDGVLYRSAQLSGDELKSAVRAYGIKSVLNLRGPNVGTRWYDEEVRTAAELGLAHYNYGLSAHRIVTGREIAELLDIMRQAPKPLLVHCKSGADRTGLIAALYRYVETGASAADSDRELSLVYGHFPYLTSRSVAMGDSFRAFVNATPQASAR
jgi:protein tyrosine phosphatase (PTP) superfamily phosphohydrolase (DUF442 family)